MHAGTRNWTSAANSSRGKKNARSTMATKDWPAAGSERRSHKNGKVRMRTAGLLHGRPCEERRCVGPGDVLRRLRRVAAGPEIVARSRFDHGIRQMTDGRDDDLLLIPPFVRCMYDAPVDVRFPLASDGMHYPTFDLATQQVVYRFDPPETVAADWVTGPGFSLATWECLRQAEAAWRRSDAAKRAWVTIRRRRAEGAK